MRMYFIKLNLSITELTGSIEDRYGQAAALSNVDGGHVAVATVMSGAIQGLWTRGGYDGKAEDLKDFIKRAMVREALHKHQAGDQNE